MHALNRYEPSFTNGGRDLIKEPDGRAVLLSDYLGAVGRLEDYIQRREAILESMGVQAKDVEGLTYKPSPRMTARCYEPTMDSAGRFFREDRQGRVVMFRDLEKIEKQCDTLISDIDLLRSLAPKNGKN